MSHKQSEPFWEGRPSPPFNSHLGFKVEEWKDGYVVISAEVKPEYCNISGLPHGGFISTLLDAATAFAGVFPKDPTKIRKAFTLSLNINFLGQAKTSLLRAVGKVTSQGSSIFYSAAKVYDSEQTLLASAQGVFRYRSGSEPVKAVESERR